MSPILRKKAEEIVEILKANKFFIQGSGQVMDKGANEVSVTGRVHVKDGRFKGVEAIMEVRFAVSKDPFFGNNALNTIGQFSYVFEARGHREQESATRVFDMGSFNQERFDYAVKQVRSAVRVFATHTLKNNY